MVKSCENDGMIIRTIPANIYLFKVKNRNTRKSCEICSKLTIKTPERRQGHSSRLKACEISSKILGARKIFIAPWTVR